MLAFSNILQMKAVPLSNILTYNPSVVWFTFIMHPDYCKFHIQK